MKMKTKTAQSIVEYICVALMFAAVGVATFFATVGSTNFSRYQDKITNKMLDANATNTTH